MPKPPAPPNLELLLPSWLLSLRADRKSEQTLKGYSDGVRFYLRWCERVHADPLDRGSLRGWVTELMDGGNRPATARARQLAVRRPSSTRRSSSRSPGTLRALLRACQPPSGATRAEALRHWRDEAILRLMLETGARAGEVVGLDVPHLDLPGGTAVIRRGKGGRGRVVPFGPHTARALGRYLRLRARHRPADTPALWVGDRGKGFTYDAHHATLKERADAAGIAGCHPHKMRHAAAHRWLAAGGSEGRPDGRRRSR